MKTCVCAWQVFSTATDSQPSVGPTQDDAFNPFALPPIDTAGQPFEASIGRLTMLEKEVANLHGSSEQNTSGPPEPTLPHPELLKLRHADDILESNKLPCSSKLKPPTPSDQHAPNL